MNPPPAPVLRLDDLFDEQAARTPDAVALVDADGPVHYAELSAAANRLAARLHGEGIGRGAFVGVHMERSRHYVASLLGILEANAAVVPLPPSYPPERLREVLAFAALDAVVVDDASAMDPSLHPRILRLSDTVDPPAASAARATGRPDDPAFVLCSSGSTGQPKMIVRSHRSFFHRLRWTWNTHPYGTDEACCQKSYMTTTHAIYELFEPLLRGVPVHVLSDQEARTLPSFWEAVRQRRISRLLVVPSMLQAALDVPGFRAPDLRVLVLMGEYVPAALARRAIAAFPATTTVYSIYGSTEASSTLVCDLRKAGDGDELPLGDPISADVRARVLDDDLAEVEAGANGMLHIGGTALFTEYFKAPAPTQAAFVERAGGERLYRTNDLVRRTADGVVHYLGRTDHVVKVRGFRVDLQEVERTLARHPDVRQCAAVTLDDGDGNATLAAFVSPASVRVPDVYRTLRAHLPDYLLPSRIVALDALPLTASGKIDRRALVACPTAGIRAAADDAPRFRTETERRVAEAWRSVLGHDGFETGSSFFEAGGTSLRTYSLMSKLQSAFGLARGQLGDDAIYRFPTIEAIAAHVDDLRAGKSVAAGNSILVVLKAAADPAAPPLFVISSAGGTLGAYERLVRTLETRREIVGVRDPFLWGGRDPTSGFQAWTATYVAAIRERQPHGPYRLLAYSSASAFAYEIARQLRRSGEEIALLALIDPLAIDSRSRSRFGHWAFDIRFRRRQLAPIARFGAGLYRAFRKYRPGLESTTAADDFAFTAAQFAELEAQVRTDPKHLLQLSALMELNSGIPFALTPSDLSALEPAQRVGALLARVRELTPDVDTAMIERLVVQYQLQVRSQHRYRLQPFDGTLLLFDPAGPYQGLLPALFSPYVARLVTHRVALAPATGRTRELGAYFSPALRSHYLGMRDETFVREVASVLQRELEAT